MNRKEALEIIESYNANPPKPGKYYHKDPHDDGKYCSSGWRYENPPVSGLLIDAILERDKDCKEYITDSESYSDEKFNQEMEKRFTDLMSRAKDTAAEEYRKNNSRLYSMVTEYNYNKITIIPASLSTQREFEKRCDKVADEIGLKKFYIYEYKDDSDVDGKIVCECAPYSGLFINDAVENAFSGAIRYCDYLKQHAKESQIYETVESLCNCIKERIEDLYKIIELDYMQRINNYIDKEKLIDSGVGK